MRSATGALSSTGGAGAVRIEQRFDVGPAQVWSALTDPRQLASWYGQVTGDLRPGGHFRVRLDGPDIDSTGRVLECRPPSVLRIRSKETDESARRGGGEPFDETVDVTIHQDGADTVLVAEVGGLPLAELAAYGVGWQLHVEALGSHLHGEPAPDIGARWQELTGHYESLAARLG